jgi:hypothetical protein
MTDRNELEQGDDEPIMTVICEMHIRRAESDVASFVERILSGLASDDSLIDIAEHDTRGTVIRMRARQPARPE